MTATTADIRWQDGALELAVPSRELTPMDHLDEHDFFVGDLVEEVDPFADMESPEPLVQHYSHWQDSNSICTS